MDDPATPRPAVAVLAALAAAKLAIHVATLARYGWFRDELYYLASTDHLQWGYVEHPPLSIALLAAVRALFGDALPAVRLVPALAGAALVVLAGLCARELGGGRFAQGLAGLAVLVAPEYLGTHHIYSMNALDHLLWAAAAFVVLRVLRTGDPRLWPVLGVVLGLGLLNKISVLWLGAGLFVGLAATRHRRLLATPGPWIAGAIAGALFVPYLAWQQAHGWPLLEFMRNATARKNVHLSPLAFLRGQLLVLNPLTAPVWLAGAWCAVAPRGTAADRDRDPAAAGTRLAATAFLVVFAILAFNPGSKISYLAAACPLALAPGAVLLERLTAGPAAARAGRAARAALVAALLASGAVLAPLALPLLSPDGAVRYARARGIAPPPAERHAPVELPQHFADQFGWQEMADEVARVYRGLAPDERRKACVYGQNYGEAGAIDVLGRPLGLPPAISGHNTYWIWGPGRCTGEVVIVIGGDAEDGRRLFDSFEARGHIRGERAMPYERDLPVYVGRGARVPLVELWPRLKEYI